MAERIEITIEKLVPGGLGLGRHQGKVVFVPGAAPGERLVVEVVEERRDYARAEIASILEASRDRREPPCPFYDACGGCALMHLTPVAQSLAKRELVLEALERGAGVHLEPETVRLVTGPELHYRSRARFHVKREEGRTAVGFHARASHRVVEVDRCLLLTEGANRALAGVRTWLGGHPERGRGLDEIEIIEGGGRILIVFVVSSNEPDRASLLSAGLRTADVGIDRVEGVSLSSGGRSIASTGEAHVCHRVAGFDFEVGAGAFFQVNRFLVDALVEEVTRCEGRLSRALDLYCGVGLFTLPLGRVADAVVGVESHASSIRVARSSARRAGMDHLSFFEERAERFAKRERLSSFDCVVLDPPRGGLAKTVTDALGASPAPELRYVSCDPPALSRDLVRLVKVGYTLTRLVVLDFFPNTHHIESVATLHHI